MSKEEQTIKLLQEENQQLKLTLASARAELQVFMTSVGSEHVVLAKMVLDGAVHLFQGANTNKAVKEDVERLLTAVERYMATRSGLVVVGSGKTQ